MNKLQLAELMRIAYLTGVDDEKEDVAQWCEQGSKERIDEVLLELELESNEALSDIILDL